MRTAVSVSVMFTDLVGSTALSSRLGADGAEELRRTHFGLLRAAAAAHGGREVKNLGDGLMVAFAGVGAALDAAVAMQQAIDLHNRSGGEPLGVRIGVATGDAEEDDGDLFGEPVVQAARLCAKADGGVILVPEVLRHLAPRGAHEFRPIGELELKGLPEPVPAAEVGWAPMDDSPVETVEISLPARLAVPHLAGFVGRRVERERLDAARKVAASGERRGVLIAGEAGMGKTRLVTEVAVAAHDAGAVVLYGRCDDELAIPYQPWVEAIGHYVTHAADDALGRHDPARLAELARLVPELHRRLPDLAAPISTEAATERHLLFGAVADVLRDIGRNQLCVVVLDDLHWADRPTVQLLRQVLATVDLGAVLVVATHRDTDLDADHPMTDALAGLHREAGVELVALHGLGDADIVALLESIAGHELPDAGIALAHAVRAETEGNPFFVGEVLRHLAETGAIVQEDGRWVAATDLADVGLPASVRAVVGQRVRRLGEVAHQVLLAAAVVGREFDLDIVATAAQVDEDTALDALEAATAAGIISESATEPDRFAFTHALVRHTLYDELPGARRVRLHRRVAEALEASLGADPGERIGELANHWLAATRAADLDKAIAYSRRAGDRAMSALAADEAIRWYTQALDALDQRPDADLRQRCALLIALGRAQEAQSVWGGIGTLCEAGDLALAVGADDLLLDAVSSLDSSQIGVVNARAVFLAERALEITEGADTRHRATVRVVLAEHVQWGPRDRAPRLLEEAITIARRAGDPGALIFAGRKSGLLGTPDRVREVMEVTGEALPLAVAAGDPVATVEICQTRATAALTIGDVAAAREAVAHISSAADLTGLAAARWWRTVQMSRLASLAGDLATAESLAEEALAISDEGPNLTGYGALLFSIRTGQGRLGELVELSEQLAIDNPNVASLQAVAPWVLAHAGERDRARALLADLRSRVEVRWDNLWLNCMHLIGQAAALAGDAVVAADAYRQLLPWAHLVSTSLVTVDDPVSHTLGLLAGVLGRPDDALVHFEAGLAMSEQIESPYHVARAKVALGGLRGDRTQVEDGLAIARRHGYAAVEADALNSLSRPPD